MKRLLIHLTSLILLFFTSEGICQDLEFGVVTVKELQETEDFSNSNSPAVLLFRNIHFEYGKILKVHERAKIYNKEGLDYASWRIPFEDIKGLKAATYNLKNGEVVRTEVEKKDIYVEEIVEDDELTLINFPNVVEGSVIELKYTVRDIGLRNIYTQGYVPIKNIDVLVSNPNYVDLNIAENPLSDIKLNREEKSREIHFTGTNIPALKQEEFVSDYNRYRGQIFIEHARAYGNNRLRTWKQVANYYFRIPNFGENLRDAPTFEVEIPRIVGNEEDPLKKAERIYNYVRENFNWDNSYGRFTKWVKYTFADKEGDAGDINFLLVAMLRAAGLDANPTLVSSRSHGAILYPTISGFNNTICHVNIFGKDYLLDATRKNAAFGELPFAFINSSALIVYGRDKHRLINTLPTKVSRKVTMVDANISEDFTNIFGRVKSRLGGYYSFVHRDNYRNASKDEFITDIEEGNGFLDLKNLIVKDIDNVGTPIQLYYDFVQQEGVEKIDDNLFISPLLFFGLEENFFKDETRHFPINFDYPFDKNLIINFTIPESYQIEDLPKPITIMLQDDIGSLKFNIIKNGNIIQASLNQKINFSVVPEVYYAGIKTLYTELLNISKSKIVLTKI